LRGAEVLGERGVQQQCSGEKGHQTDRVHEGPG
jgi:hypothetical protein